MSDRNSVAQEVAKRLGITTTTNYDLSLESFLLNALKSNERFQDEAEKFVKNLKIIHVYGQIQGESYDINNLIDSYGEIASHTRNPALQFDVCLEKAEELKNNIKTIGELKQVEVAQEQHIQQAIEKLQKANKIFILGFGFDKDNTALLKLNSIGINPRKPIEDQPRFHGRKIYCTNFGGLRIIKNKIYNLFCNVDSEEEFAYWCSKPYHDVDYLKSYLNIANASCHKLFSEHFSLSG